MTANALILKLSSSGLEKRPSYLILNGNQYPQVKKVGSIVTNNTIEDLGTLYQWHVAHVQYAVLHIVTKLYR